MPIAIGMGLIVLLVGMTMIVRSSDDKVIASAQKQTSNSFAVSEGGVSRSLSLLNGNYQPFLRLSYDPVNPKTSKTYLGPNGISGDGDEEGTTIDEWSTIPNPPPCFDSTSFTSELLQGNIGGAASNNYKMLAYRYNGTTETGTLLLQGQDSSSKAVTVIQQSMAIQDQLSSDPANFPGLMAQDIDLNNNDVLGAIAGNVVCTDLANCPIPNDSSSCVNGEPTQAALLNAINAGPNGVVQGRISVEEFTWPPLPSAPTNPDTDSNAESLSSITDTTTLSPPTDSTDPYIYVIDNIALSGSNTLIVDTSYRPIHLFIKGDITLSGSANINHTGSPERLHIYGNPADNNESNDQQFTLSGGSTASHLFIYAPDADVGINGGSSNPDFYGAIWVKTWGEIGSSSNNAEIEVPDNMAQLLGSPLSDFVVGTQTSASKRWERRPAL